MANKLQSGVMAEEITNNKEEDFFLPDLCQAQSILFLVLIAELLVFVLVLFDSAFFRFDWATLGLTSLFVQWLVLSSAAILCNIRPWLMSLTVPRATTIAYSLIMVMTLIFSAIAEMVLHEMTITPAGWGRLVRNLVITGIVTGIAFRYFFLIHQLRRQEQAELTSRIQALQSRIRPHFLFNSMNIIASLISVDPDLAEEVVVDLSALFRASLDEATSEPVRLDDELDLCRKYLHIEGLRLDDRLAVEWQIETETQALRIPLLTLQPLLENAIYHGIQPLTEGGTITVTLKSDDDQVEITITNPVSGKANRHEGGNRMALENIRNRMNAVYGPSASLTTEKTESSFHTRLIYPRKA